MNVLTTATMEEMKVADLRKFCAENDIPRYSKANKATLIGMINGFNLIELEKMTVAELKQICADMGINGCRKLRKELLIKKILTYTDTDVDGSVEENNVNDEEYDIIDISPDEIDDDDDEEEVSENDNTVTVTSGARSRVVPFIPGKTVWHYHKDLMYEMGIDAHPGFTVNNCDVANTRIIEAGDVIDFTKTNGGKG